MTGLRGWPANDNLRAPPGPVSGVFDLGFEVFAAFLDRLTSERSITAEGFADMVRRHCDTALPQGRADRPEVRALLEIVDRLSPLVRGGEVVVLLGAKRRSDA